MSNYGLQPKTIFCLFVYHVIKHYLSKCKGRGGLSPIQRGFALGFGFVYYKKGALDSQSQVIMFTSCLPTVGGSLRVLRLLPPLKLVAMI
jgi:hypothetical protein